MLPMIRLSELYYIQAEHLCRKGDISGAINKIDIVEMPETVKPEVPDKCTKKSRSSFL